MCEDDRPGESFEERIRWIAREVSRSADRIARVDVDEIAEAIGIDPDRAREWADVASRWMREQAERVGEDPLFREARQPRGHGAHPQEDAPAERADGRTSAEEDPLRAAAPHPLDLPSEEQGRALAALDSGRWTIEAGSRRLLAHGGPAPEHALGLVRELESRDWIDAEGSVTLAGRHALSRWLDAAAPRNAIL
jgi:hypothetical protein